jgi:DNA modification methylase
LNKRKRALTNVGGRVAARGDPEAARLLARALTVESGGGLDRWTHGFHTYPARMHPDTAAVLVGALSRPGDVVLDPFCGSGTVVLEAMVAARRAVGRDLGPLAVRLTRLRCAVTSETQRTAVREVARRVAGIAEARSRDGAEPEAPAAVGRWQNRFDLVTYTQLAWLRALLARERDAFAREALELVLAAILVKVSRQVSDTDRRVRPGRSAGATRLFRAKADELARMLGRLARDARRAQAPRADVREDDARTLGTVEPGSVDAVVTSPPYPNVYDYAEHHALRACWLGLDDGGLREGEVGSRRSFAGVAQGLARWDRDGAAWVAAVARVLRPGGRAAVLCGDGATSECPVLFDECLGRWAENAGLRVVATASQSRRAFDDETRRAFTGRARREHLVLLEKP